MNDLPGVAPPPTSRSYARPLDAVDAVRHHVRGTDIVVRAEKRVRSTDPYLSGHFPGLTLYPAVFLLEGMRQAVGTVVDRWLEIELVHSLRVLRPMLEDDVLHLSILVKPVGGRLWADMRVACGDQGPDVALIIANLVDADLVDAGPIHAGVR